jgi:MFS transporter, SP family, general alpha glucoside:H+ symporter
MPIVCKCSSLSVTESEQDRYEIYGLLLNSASWFVLGQLFASVALDRLSAIDPYNYKTPIYTQVQLIHYQQLS